MSGTQPVAVYAMKVPAGDVMVPAVPDFAAMFQLSMAAIDPSAEPEFEDGDKKRVARSTLKLIRVPGELFDDDSDDSDYSDIETDEDDVEESSGDEEVNGGPSDPSKAKKVNKLDLVKAIAEEDDDEDDDDEDDAEDEAAAKTALMKILKGKGKASESAEEDGDDDDDEDSLELEEVVVCTLDPDTHYQQALNIVVGENEKIFFKVSGTHEVHLTGNYVIPVEDGQDPAYAEDEDDYDLSPDENELDALEDDSDDEESDELDDLVDPRIMEVDTDEEEAPKLIKPAEKGKNKRPAEDSDEEETHLDDLVAKSIKLAEPTTNGEEKPLTKSQKKKLKKLKKNDGEAAPVERITEPSEKRESKGERKSGDAGKKDAATNGEKKVQFAKNLEQGPTPSGTPPSKETSKSGATLGVRDVQGVTVDDRKLGSGPQAKKGSRVEMRYIGKLENGKVFDANKKGKPFSFKLGAGEVIKGWDIGVVGMTVGGERRLTIPANLGYGSKGAPPQIPPNSKLIFDVKVLGVK